MLAPDCAQLRPHRPAGGCLLPQVRITLPLPHHLLLSVAQPLSKAKLQQGFNKIYEASLVNSLRRMYRRHHALFEAETARSAKREQFAFGRETWNLG